jgi:ribosome-associated protein
VRFPESQALACVAARAADDKKADDTIVLSVGELLSITEYFVVTSASNRRLVRTIVESVEEQVRAELDRPPLRIDFGDVVVHVFAEEMRQYYEIERLYRDVPRVEWQSVVPADQG